MKSYKVSLTTKLEPPQKGMIAIEPEDYTMAEIKTLKKEGAKLLAYLSAGSVSDKRSYYKTLKPYQLKRLDDWPHERYIDLRRTAVREWCQKQAKMFKGAGFVGYWLDNIDVYEEYKTTGMFNAITATLQAIKAVGGYVMINGGSAYLTDLLIPHKTQLGAYKEKANAKKMASTVKAKGFKATIIEMDDLYKVQAGAFTTQAGADQTVEKLRAAGFETAKRTSLYYGKASALVDGVTQEEVFTLIKNYSGKGKFGTQKSDQSLWYRKYMKRLVNRKVQGFLLEYTRSSAMKKKIKTWGTKFKMSGWWISGDVNL